MPPSSTCHDGLLAAAAAEMLGMICHVARAGGRGRTCSAWGPSALPPHRLPASTAGTRIANVSQLSVLTALKHLHSLDLEGAPLADEPTYRAKVFEMLAVLPHFTAVDELNKNGERGAQQTAPCCRQPRWPVHTTVCRRSDATGGPARAGTRRWGAPTGGGSVDSWPGGAATNRLQFENLLPPPHASSCCR